MSGAGGSGGGCGGTGGGVESWETVTVCGGLVGGGGGSVILGDEVRQALGTATVGKGDSITGGIKDDWDSGGL